MGDSAPQRPLQGWPHWRASLEMTEPCYRLGFVTRGQGNRIRSCHSGQRRCSLATVEAVSTLKDDGGLGGKREGTDTEASCVRLLHCLFMLVSLICDHCRPLGDTHTHSQLPQFRVLTLRSRQLRTSYAFPRIPFLEA